VQLERLSLTLTCTTHTCARPLSKVAPGAI
jgi:hypothetical protein